MNEVQGPKWWRFLNSPLVVVLLGVVLWQVLQLVMVEYTMSRRMGSWMGEYTNITSSVGSALFGGTNEGTRWQGAFSRYQAEKDRQALERLQLSELLTVTNLQRVPGGHPGREKYTMTFVNGSDRIVQDVELSVQFFNEAGVMVDVEEETLRGRLIRPGESCVAAVTRYAGPPNAEESVLASNRAVSAQARVTAFEVVVSDPETQN